MSGDEMLEFIREKLMVEQEVANDRQTMGTDKPKSKKTETAIAEKPQTNAITIQTPPAPTSPTRERKGEGKGQTGGKSKNQSQTKGDTWQSAKEGKGGQNGDVVGGPLARIGILGTAHKAGMDTTDGIGPAPTNAGAAGMQAENQAKTTGNASYGKSHKPLSGA